MNSFHLTIARLGENLFDGSASSVRLPGTEGVFEVLANHEPLVSRLRAGEVRVASADGQSYHFSAPEGGLAEISSNQATVIL